MYPVYSQSNWEKKKSKTITATNMGFFKHQFHDNTTWHYVARHLYCMSQHHCMHPTTHTCMSQHHCMHPTTHTSFCVCCDGSRYFQFVSMCKFHTNWRQHDTAFHDNAVTHSVKSQTTVRTLCPAEWWKHLLVTETELGVPSSELRPILALSLASSWCFLASSTIFSSFSKLGWTKKGKHTSVMPHTMLSPQTFLLKGFPPADQVNNWILASCQQHRVLIKMATRLSRIKQLLSAGFIQQMEDQPGRFCLIKGTSLQEFKLR